jgi:competence protein ComEC
MFWLLRRMRVSDPFASALTILLTVAYALLTDVGAPVWRATLMLALYLGTRLLYRRKAILNTIGAAALALLFIAPEALLGASFQLSFLCVLVIAGIGTPVLERTSQPLSRALRSLDAIGYDAALSPPFGTSPPRLSDDCWQAATLSRKAHSPHLALGYCAGATCRM